MGYSKFLGGFVIGSAVGIAAGLLIAPVSGDQTRNRLMRRSKKYSQQAIEAVRQYLDNKKKSKGEVGSGHLHEGF